MRIRRVVLALVAALVAMQFVPLTETNVPVDRAQTIYATLHVPAGVQSIFERSCQNCHSNETHWPWYGQVAPVSWLIARDVLRGRRELNLSEWGRYPGRRKDRKLKEICEQLQKGEMPMNSYVWVHPEARLTDEDRRAVCSWTEETRRRLGAGPGVQS